MTRRRILTREDLSKPIPCKCARCGGDAVIFPEPAPRGTCVCTDCLRRALAAESES